ncbi:MAG: hypothetical protein ACC669_00735 [bacterium]
MSNPLVYILAPFALAFSLFVLYLVVSIILRDPARPFRMFAAGPLDDNYQESLSILDRLENSEMPERERAALIERLEEIVTGKDKGHPWDSVRGRLLSVKRGS